MELTTGILIVFGLIVLAGVLFAVEVVSNERLRPSR